MGICGSGFVRTYPSGRIPTTKRGGVRAATRKERRAMDNRHRHRHHCHPHHCAAITIAVAAPPKPSLRRHRRRCAATFSAIAAPHRCAAIAALPPQSLRSHCLRRRCATTTSTQVSRAPVNDASASRARDDPHNNQKVREVRGEEEDDCGGGRDGGRVAGDDNEAEIPNEVTGGRGARNCRRAGGPLKGKTSYAD